MSKSYPKNRPKPSHASAAKSLQPPAERKEEVDCTKAAIIQLKKELSQIHSIISVRSLIENYEPIIHGESWTAVLSGKPRPITPLHKTTQTSRVDFWHNWLESQQPNDQSWSHYIRQGIKRIFQQNQPLGCSSPGVLFRDIFDRFSKELHRNVPAIQGGQICFDHLGLNHCEREILSFLAECLGAISLPERVVYWKPNDPTTKNEMAFRFRRMGFIHICEFLKPELSQAAKKILTTIMSCGTKDPTKPELEMKLCSGYCFRDQRMQKQITDFVRRSEIPTLIRLCTAWTGVRLVYDREISIGPKSFGEYPRCIQEKLLFPFKITDVIIVSIPKENQRMPKYVPTTFTDGKQFSPADFAEIDGMQVLDPAIAESYPGSMPLMTVPGEITIFKSETVQLYYENDLRAEARCLKLYFVEDISGDHYYPNKQRPWNPYKLHGSHHAERFAKSTFPLF